MEMVMQLAEAYRAGARSRGRNPNLGEGVGLCRTIHFTNNKSDIYGMVDKPAGMLLSGLWKVRGCLAKKAPYPSLANTLLTS
jgi:hypothetical protein